MFADACCEGNIKVARTILSSNRLSSSQTRALQTILSSLARYRDSSQTIQKRVHNAIDMVGYTLTIHNHKEIRDMTRHMENLAQENRDLTEKMKDMTQETSVVTKKLQELTQVTVDDSAIVNIITIVSAVYIPGGFVATIFGMNFFEFNDDTRNIMIGNDFWIFIVIWLVLIVITGGLFVGVWWVKKRNSGRRRDGNYEKVMISTA
ncbi:hypothetical protein JX266_007274 [Neoarthrinium moseri]|nr:hypothetical protein JX266_007274 [Neoarthrinium moseri]